MKAFGAGEIEIGLIDRDHFHDRRESGEDGGDAVAPLGIFFVVAIEEDGMRTEAARGAEGHGGVNAVFARLVTGSGDDTALVGAAAYYNRFAAKVGSVEEFDGDKECVHIHVENGTVEERILGLRGGVVLGAEAGKVRHRDSVRRNYEIRQWRRKGLQSESSLWNDFGGFSARVFEKQVRTWK